MENKFILSPKDVLKSQRTGVKAFNLAVMKEVLGFSVPPFVVITGQTLCKFTELKDEILAQIDSSLKSDLYAVRSSTLLEDSENKSFAGQFHTEIRVKKEGLKDAIQKVMAQAKQKIKDMTELAVIIQEYIEPDVSGVTFTRNPNSSRETVIDYYSGTGEELVSGQVLPKSIKFYRHQKVTWPSALSDFNNIIEKFWLVEKYFGTPLDIEWCIKKGKFYFLQSRPITTISREDLASINFLEQNLPKETYFDYEKTDISEIMPRPKNLSFSLLERIYAENGPVANVYKKFGVIYHKTDFLKILGNELYVDRDLETKTLLPACRFDPRSQSVKLAGLSGLITTVINITRLGRINVNQQDFIVRLEKYLNQKPQTDFSRDYLDFLKKYELVFEINLLSSITLKKLENISKLEKIPISKFLDSDQSIFDVEVPALSLLSDGFVGNSLDIADESHFQSALYLNKDKSLQSWWSNLPPFKKKYYQRIISDALVFNQLREMGRWLIVKLISNTRQDLQNILEKNLVYFLTVDEALSTDFSIKELEERQKQYCENGKYCLPKSITNNYIEIENIILGISSGITEGKICDTSSLENKGILYTKILSPDLTIHFPKIKGIISETGGYLSHLAIMAREAKIPVVSNVNLKNLNLKIGDQVQIDGSLGKIEKLN